MLFERALLLPAGCAELHRKYGERTERVERGAGRLGGPGEIGAVLLSALALSGKCQLVLLTLIAEANINSFPYRRTACM